MNIDDITIQYEEGGEVVVKEISKEFLTKGAWVTVLFKYQELDKNTQDYKPVKYSIRRYQKRGGVFLPKSKFNISSNDQAHKIIATLSKWLQEDEQQLENED